MQDLKDLSYIQHYNENFFNLIKTYCIRIKDLKIFKEYYIEYTKNLKNHTDNTNLYQLMFQNHQLKPSISQLILETINPNLFDKVYMDDLLIYFESKFYSIKENTLKQILINYHNNIHLLLNDNNIITYTMMHNELKGFVKPLLELIKILNLSLNDDLLQDDYLKFIESNHLKPYENQLSFFKKYTKNINETEINKIIEKIKSEYLHNFNPQLYIKEKQQEVYKNSWYVNEYYFHKKLKQYPYLSDLINLNEHYINQLLINDDVFNFFSWYFDINTLKPWYLNLKNNKKYLKLQKYIKQFNELYLIKEIEID